jgi:hypothetical protein
VLLAAVLKLFPVFAAGMLARDGTRRALLGTGGVVLATVVYVAALHTQIHAELNALPQNDKYSFGLRRVAEWLGALTSADGRRGIFAWQVGLVALVALVAWRAARGLRARLAPVAATSRELDLFAAGACVYVGAYAIARSFDYRLCFCLLTVPFLVRLAEARVTAAWLTLAGLLGALCLDGFYSWPIETALNTWSRWTQVGGGPFPQPLPLAAIAQLLLFAGLASLLVAVAPPLPELLGRFRPTRRSPEPSAG